MVLMLVLALALALMFNSATERTVGVTRGCTL